MPRKKAGATTSKPKTNTKRDVGDPHYDLIKVFEGKNIADMDDEELEKRIHNLQAMRLIRVTTSKKATALDLVLAQIDLDKARLYLDFLEKTEIADIKNKDKEKEKEKEKPNGRPTENTETRVTSTESTNVTAANETSNA
jgi:hypothetical protein